MNGYMLIQFFLGILLHFFIQNLSLLYGELTLFHKGIDQILGSFSGCGYCPYACQKYFFDSFCDIDCVIPFYIEI